MLFFAYLKSSNPRLCLNEVRGMAKLMDVDELARYLEVAPPDYLQLVTQ